MKVKTFLQNGGVSFEEFSELWVDNSSAVTLRDVVVIIVFVVVFGLVEDIECLELRDDGRLEDLQKTRRPKEVVLL